MDQDCFTNQTKHLKTALVEAGIPSTIQSWPPGGYELTGEGVTVAPFKNRLAVHYCRSIWHLPGARSRKVGEFDGLPTTPVCGRSCDMPVPGIYSVRARLTYDASMCSIRLTIIEFIGAQELPVNYEPVIEDIGALEVAACA